MKGLTVFLLLTIPLSIFAQGVFTNETHSTLQKVINDYPFKFKNIKGELISDNPQTTDYASTVEIPGSLNTVITKYSAENNKEIYSWKCLLMQSENYEEATTKYKVLFDEI